MNQNWFAQRLSNHARTTLSISQEEIMAISVLEHRNRLGIKDCPNLYIDGRWVQSQSDETWTHIHPATH
jgi:hypothetical protein